MQDNKGKPWAPVLNAQLRHLMHDSCGVNFTQCLALVRQGADVNKQDSANRTLLMRAARDGRADVMQDLIAMGARVDLKDGIGRTALHYAAQRDNPQCIDVLVAAGACLNSQSIEQWTPLMSAVCNGSVAVVARLLEVGADAEIKDNRECTPLMRAVKTVEITTTAETVKLLLAHGADMGVRDTLGKTIDDILKEYPPGEFSEEVKEAIQQERDRRTAKAFRSAAGKGTPKPRRIIRKRMGAGYHAG
ncbi:MAG: ankyrin repeat domain-containing protein [Alphaproteobacteria bacterium]|nr:ankyrin repeat domain-containing protein [Alphaproteobacteria bacterium]